MFWYHATCRALCAAETRSIVPSPSTSRAGHGRVNDGACVKDAETVVGKPHHSVDGKGDDGGVAVTVTIKVSHGEIVGGGEPAGDNARRLERPVVVAEPRHDAVVVTGGYDVKSSITIKVG